MALIFQCLSCRALTSAANAMVDDTSAALVCGVCGVANRLPRADSRAATVVDVVVQNVVTPALVAVSSAAPALPMANPAPSAALVPAAPSVAASATFSTEQLDKIRMVIARAPATNERQADLASHFERLLQSWAPAEGHKAILQKASASGELAFLGGSYRAVLQAAPSDAAAKKGQSDLLALAMAQLSPNTGDIMATTSSAKNWMLAGVFLACVLGILAIITMRTDNRTAKGHATDALEAQP